MCGELAKEDAKIEIAGHTCSFVESMAANERLDAIGRLLIDPEDDPVKETAWTGDSTGARLVNPVPGTGSQQPTPALASGKCSLAAWK